MNRRNGYPRRLPFAEACLLILLVGCNQRGETLQELIEQAGKLPGVRASKHSKLREEFRLVELSQTLPEQLNSEPLPGHQNAAVALAAALDNMGRVEKINEQAAAFLGALPAAEPAFIATESAALTALWGHDIAAVTNASQLPQCDFGIKYELGYFNQVDFLYQAAAASRLLLVDALYSLNKDPDKALAQVTAAWQWVDWLAQSGHLEARVQATLVRGDALNVVEVLVNRPMVTVADLHTVQSVFARSVESWPSLESTLVRERALALVSYEAIRLGLADMLFTLEERSQLREEGVYDALRNATPEQIDADEAAYLAYMREVIAVADKPFFLRKKHLVECDRLLRAGEHVDSFPWFANRLFVLNNSLTLAQAEIARDRTRVEGWLHLLAAATGETAPASESNPLNGEKYVTHNRGSAWFVALGDRRSVNPRLTLPAQ